MYDIVTHYMPVKKAHFCIIAVKYTYILLIYINREITVSNTSATCKTIFIYFNYFWWSFANIFIWIRKIISPQLYI